eukprot:SAG22_NODE_13278_length_411_cov_1.657051_1_plen_98_part_01
MAGGSDCGAGSAHRGLAEAAVSDCVLELVDAASHLFRRADRDPVTGPLAEQLAARGEETAGANYVAFGVGWDGRAKFCFLVKAVITAFPSVSLPFLAV